MPTKFRKNVWIKRGDFVIVTNIEEGDKVKAEISTILYKDQIKFIKAEGCWPQGFLAEEQLSQLQLKDNPDQEERDSGDSESSEDDSDLFQNTNRPVYEESDSEEETESEED